MQFEQITYEVTGKTAIVTLNRPEKRNALSAKMLRELHDALLEADEDNPVHCVMLRGAGPHFCAGADLGEDTRRAAATTIAAGRRSTTTRGGWSRGNACAWRCSTCTSR